MDDFRKIIEGKNVLLLGPASYLYDEGFEEDLSEYDIVVKMNRMVETDLCKEFTNDRCDILYHCLDVSPQYGNVKYDLKEISRKGVQHIRIPYPPVNGWYQNMINIFNKENNGLIKYSVTDTELYTDLYLGCGQTSPNTGVIAIFDLLKSNPLSLTIRGITFFKGGYNKKYRSKVVTEKEVEMINSRVQNHNTNKQRAFVKERLQQYDNINIDHHFAYGLELR